MKEAWNLDLFGPMLKGLLFQKDFYCVSPKSDRTYPLYMQKHVHVVYNCVEHLSKNYTGSECA